MNWQWLSTTSPIGNFWWRRRLRAALGPRFANWNHSQNSVLMLHVPRRAQHAVRNATWLKSSRLTASHTKGSQLAAGPGKHGLLGKRPCCTQLQPEAEAYRHAKNCSLRLKHTDMQKAAARGYSIQTCKKLQREADAYRHAKSCSLRLKHTDMQKTAA